jgi:hypothetical protein
MLRNLMGGVLMLAIVGACATVPKANPGAEARLREANASLDALTADLTTFYGHLEALLYSIKTFSEHPGWNDLAAMISATGSIPEGEDEISVDQDLANQLDDWTAKWGESGEQLYSQYLSLADRCTISEARRIGLIGRLASMQAMYLEVTFLELSANRQAQAEAAFGTVEALSKTQEELESYSLNDIGLYAVTAGR